MNSLAGEGRRVGVRKERRATWSGRSDWSSGSVRNCWSGRSGWSWSVWSGGSGSVRSGWSGSVRSGGSRGRIVSTMTGRRRRFGGRC